MDPKLRKSLRDQRAQRKLELAEAAARVPPEVRRHIINDYLGMWVATIVFLVIAHFVFG